MIPRDKLLHLAAGAAVSFAALMFAGPGWAAIAGIVAGIAKELYDRDRRDRHTVDGMDAVATAIPGALIWLASLI